jgi:ABC-2 type transport system permease protein
MWRITWQELKDRKWSLLAYTLGSLVMLWLYVATFRSSQQSIQQLQELVKTYPKAFLDAIGLGNLNLDTLEKYLNAKHFSLIWPILAIILALSRAGGQIAGEIQSGTMGLLLALPLDRWRIFVAKYAAGLATITIFTGVSVFGVVPLAAAYNIPTHLHILWGAWLLTLLFMWAIYSFGLAISAWVSERGTVYGWASAVIFYMYVLYIASLIGDKISFLRNYTIFYYFNTQEALATGHVMGRSWLVFGGIIVVTTALAAWRFNARDVNV